MGAACFCVMGVYCVLSTLGFVVVLALYMTSSGYMVCSEDTVAGDKTEHTVGSTKVEIFSLDESSNQIGGEMCDCQPCFTTFSLLEILVIARMGVGIIAAAYKIWFILEKRHKLSVEKKKVKKNKNFKLFS